MNFDIDSQILTHFSSWWYFPDQQLWFFNDKDEEEEDEEEEEIKIPRYWGRCRKPYQLSGQGNFKKGTKSSKQSRRTGFNFNGILKLQMQWNLNSRTV